MRHGQRREQRPIYHAENRSVCPNPQCQRQDRDSGEMRPGKDGLAFRAELADEIIEDVKAAKDGAP